MCRPKAAICYIFLQIAQSEESPDDSFDEYVMERTDLHALHVHVPSN